MPNVELLEGHRCSVEVFVCLGDDYIDDKLLRREAHPEGLELVHLSNFFPTMRVELPFGIIDVCHPPRAHCGLFKSSIPWKHRSRSGVFGCWFVIVVNFNTLAPEIIALNSLMFGTTSRSDARRGSTSRAVAAAGWLFRCERGPRLSSPGNGTPGAMVTVKLNFSMWNTLPSSISGMCTR